jgi:hypothetical protein
MIINVLIVCHESKGLVMDMKVLATALIELSKQFDWNLLVQGLFVPADLIGEETSLDFDFDFVPHIIIHIQQIYKLPKLNNKEAVQILVPNPEWITQQTIERISQIKQIWHKTKMSFHFLGKIFANHTNHRYIGFTSPDTEKRVTSYGSFGHFKGKSVVRNSRMILDVWQRRSDFPELKLHFWSPHIETSFFNVPKWFRFENMYVKIGEIPDEDYYSDLAATGIHLCTSSTEGFGHYLNEARSVGAVPVVIDGLPMNELVDTSSGILINPKSPPKEVAFGFSYSISEIDLEKAIDKILLKSNTDLKQIGMNARKRYEADRSMFYFYLRKTVEELISIHFHKKMHRS